VTTTESQLPRSLESGSESAAFLARIQWPFTVSVLAYGVRIGIRLDDASVVETLPGYLPPGSKYEEFMDSGRLYSLLVKADETSATQQYSVYLNEVLLVRRSTLEAALRTFESDLQLYVADMAPDRVFVHAGVVAWQGRGILLPGRSFCGKSTLVVELIRAGAEYYSDEYAVLDSTGSVHPYPRPLSIRQRGVGVTKRPIHTLGGHAGSNPLPVGLVVMSNFRSNSEWRPQRLSPGLGALALLANTIPARRAPNLVLATLHQIVAGAPVLASERGEACEVVESILALATRD
jgi:hypothetical protein